MTSITIYVTHDDYSYMKLAGLSPSELFKKAIIMHKEGEIRMDKMYNEEILHLKEVVKKLQNTITQVGETKWHLEN